MYSYYKKWDGKTLEDEISRIETDKKQERRILILDASGKPLAAIVPVKDLAILEQKPIPELFCICECNCTWPAMSGPLSFYRCDPACKCEYCQKNCRR